ncbi:MAG: Hpt domain-containing protein [Bacteroidales bacterium]|jgi:HPt (histidine-containing phosphotransfer) domain-containing protein|nr:Hpt domain-containing protein [Bacteroidales bacterium]
MITNLEYLYQMTGGDREMMKEMVELFLDQLTEIRGEFSQLMKEKNWIEISRLAHKTKSSALVMGIDSMASEMIELESLTKEARDPGKTQSSIDRFNALTDIVNVELKAFLMQSE